MDRMKTIGLVGGVASGKSLAARMLADLGAGLLDADRVGHDLLADDDDVRAAVRRRWGDAVVGEDGRIDRSALARRVFAENEQGTADRQFLEGLLHPRIRRRLEAQGEKFLAEGRSAVVLDAPLLLEAGWGPMCDLILMIDAPREDRLHRARQRGWSESDFARREAAQWPVDHKRRHAHVVIANDRGTEQLRQAIADFWDHSVVPRHSGA